jgi:hypothetical protein
VPAHNRSVASELDLSEACVRALQVTLRRGVVTGEVATNTRRALVRRGLLSLDGHLTDQGRLACARLFPGAEKVGAS